MKNEKLIFILDLGTPSKSKAKNYVKSHINSDRKLQYKSNIHILV